MQITYKNLLPVLCLSFLTACNQPANQNSTSAPVPNEQAIESTTFQVPPVSEEAKNFYVANDLGRNGYYEQKKIAELMGNMAEKVDIEFVAAVGDTHHFMGVNSTNDPLWNTNYELIYSHPELMIEWFAVCGNHEYRGNTNAVIDYSHVSRRWEMPSYYYARTVEAGENQEALLLFIDTTPLIDKYHKEVEKYPDVAKQDYQKQLKWIDQTLKESNAKWKIVLGHHPIYADTKKSDSERTDLQKRLQPILDQNKVDMYVCGHIHNFQHIHVPGSEVEYVVNSSGSLARKVKPVEGTRFCSSDAGFSIVSMEDDKLAYYMVNADGEIIYSFDKTK